jgi:dihydroxyacetone kinase-like protein
MRELHTAALTNVLRRGAETIIANEPVLTRADQQIGDGDHGVGMARGFRAALIALDRVDVEASPGTPFEAVGKAIMTTAGGASGAIFGTFFTAVGKACPDSTLDAPGLHRALAAGADAVMARGKAQAGDKTMLDALLPAIAALGRADDADIAIAVADAAIAAKQGMKATASMLAGAGRSRNLGERVLGHVDPGAMSMSFLFEGFAQALLPLDHEEAVKTKAKEP